MFETKTAAETEKLLRTGRRGLTEQEAKARLKKYGANEMEEKKGKGVGERFLSQLMDPLIYVLIAAGVVSILLGEAKDAAIIAVVVLLNAAVGVIQEGKAANLLRMYEDKPMNFDCWDIDMYYSEKYWDAVQADRIEWTERGPVRATLEIDRSISNSVIRQKIHFYADSRRIDFVTWVDWKEHQTLLKVHFPVDVHTDEATFDVQFGNLTRKTHQNTSWDVARFESCGQKWIDVSEGHYGVSLLNDCKYGHSVKDSNMALTLIKSGIEPNPVSDQEEHEILYALYPHTENWRAAGTVAESYNLNQPALVMEGNAPEGRFSLVSVDQPNVILETVKKAEDGQGTIVRMYESENARTKVKMTFNRAFEKAYICNLLEEVEQEAKVTGNEVEFVIKPYEVVTVKLV